MSENFEAERDVAFRSTIIFHGNRQAAGAELYVPDKEWTEFVAFVNDLDMEQRVRRLVRNEWATIKAEQQADCPHERAKIIDNSTGLLRCDNCGVTFTYADMEGKAPDSDQLEEEKAEATATMRVIADKRPKH